MITNSNKQDMERTMFGIRDKKKKRKTFFRTATSERKQKEVLGL